MDTTLRGFDIISWPRQRQTVETDSILYLLVTSYVINFDLFIYLFIEGLY